MTDDLITQLCLQPHPEGGFYREYYRADVMVSTARGMRPASTAIYFLLGPTDISRLHRIQSDELWCWHSGGLITLTVIAADGTLTQHVLGPPSQGGSYTIVVRAGQWFGATTNNQGVLVSAVVAPGFDFADFELGSRHELEAAYPHIVDHIRRLT